MASFKWWSLLIVLSAIASQYVLSSADDSIPIPDDIPIATYPVAYALTHPNHPCHWKVYVQTGNVYWAGTNAVVSLKIYDKSGDNISVSNLQQHGVAPGEVDATNPVTGAHVKLSYANYDFFERGHKDGFEFEQRCLKYDICKVELSHNNGGYSPGWFVDYITVQDLSMPHRFDFNRWLDTNHGLSATIDLCKS